MKNPEQEAMENLKLINCLNSDIQKNIDKLRRDKKALLEYITSVPDSVVYHYKD